LKPLPDAQSRFASLQSGEADIVWDDEYDYKTWTFKLRPGVKFQDGTPFNAAAVKENFDRATRADSMPMRH
jgi:ABC-type transport system substrate-binding protein